MNLLVKRSLFLICTLVFYTVSFYLSFSELQIKTAHAQEEVEVHPEGWILQHGKDYVEFPDQCMACHGEKLDGGLAEVTCDQCHLLPKHPDDWKETHGKKYLADKSQCTFCHGDQPFSVKKRPWSMNCTRCHSINADISRWQPESHTSQLYINFYNNSQILENRFNNREFETNHYLGISYTNRSKQMTFNSQFGFNREWIQKSQDFDIYEAYFQFDNLFNNHLTVALGRQPFLSNADFYLVDGISLYISPSKWFDIYAFAGVPRYIEQEDLTGEVGLASGISWILTETNYTNARIDFIYNMKNFTNNTNDDTNKMILGLSASKGISIFKIYGLGEYDLSHKLIQTGTLGVEIYPFAKKIGFLIEGSYFNETRNDDLQTIFKVFSVDELWQIKSGMFFNIVKDLNLYQNFSFQRYDVLQGFSRNGYNAEIGGQYYVDKINLDADLAYYFIRSYGGTLHGARLYLYEKWSNRFFSSLLLDFVTYTKVTNDNNQGFDAALTSGVQIIPGMVLSATIEYLRNDVFKNDVRGIFRFDYSFSKKFMSTKDKKELKKQKNETKPSNES